MQTAAGSSKTALALLDAARDELVAATRQGSAGRSAVERYADRVDALLQRLFAEAPVAAQPVAVFALGGYGRRHLCLHSDVDVLVLFDGPLGPDDERFVSGLLTPLWDLRLVLGHQVRELDDFRRLETDNPEFLLALLDARAVAGDVSLLDRFKALFHQPQAHAFILQSLQQLMAERHAQFNGTLYQLEPDIKEAPGALRDLTATRTIVGLTDPLLLRSGPADAARLEDAENFFLRIRSVLHPRGEAQPERAQPSDAGEGRRDAGVSGHASAARRAADGRLLPARARRAPVARVDVQGGAGAGRRQPRPDEQRRAVHQRAAGRLPAGDVADRVSGGDRRGLRRRRRGAVLHPASTPTASARGSSFRRRRSATRCCGSSSRARGSTRGCPRCTTAGCSAGCFPSSRRSPAAWCATSTTSTRWTSTRCRRSATSSG